METCAEKPPDIYQVHQASDEELTTELFSQDSSYSNSEIITGMAPDVSAGGHPAVSQTDQPFTMATESSQDSRQSQSQSAGRFVLESDHLALKNNSDYQLMLKTLATLEAQRMKALQAGAMPIYDAYSMCTEDIDELITRKRKALKNPEAFFESLVKGSCDPLPTRQEVANVPEINLSKYTKGLKLNSRLLHHKYGTRQKAENRHFQTLEDATTDQGNKNLVRGKVVDDSKPRTFNQLWTPEEQTKLEQLLELYPPEEVESRRWEKIATALGNRTVKQVQSRVQKYFIKLAKAGLPVPGRKPSAMLLSNKSKFKRREKPRSKLSTFFSSLEPKVYMEGDQSVDEEEADTSQSDDDDDGFGTSTRQAYIDDDYMDFRTNNDDSVGYNYLDPNFCPAT